MARLKRATTRTLFTRIKDQGEGVYNGVMTVRNTYPDLMELPRGQAKELQEKALLSIVREERPAHNGYIYKIK